MITNGNPPMSQFQLHDLTTAPRASGAILAELSGAGRAPYNLPRMLAESPTVLDAYRQLCGLFARASLAPLEQQVVYLAAAHANQCHYCRVPNPMLGDHDPAKAERIAAAIREERRLDDPRLQVLRRFTTLMTEQRGWVAEDQVESFLAAGFSQENLLEVILGISLVTLTSYANHVTATPVDH